MKQESDELKTTFELPDAPSVLQVLRYEAAIEQPGISMYERLWPAVPLLATNWQSPVPLDTDLNAAMNNYQVIQVIKWASLSVFSFYLELKRIEKN